MINTNTYLYGVFGNPVSHSLSPLMHNCAFAETGTPGVYLAFQVDDIGAAISAVRALGLKGVSITIPHKTTVLEYLDKIDETAQKIGAVNTVVNKNGVLVGYNTDSSGALRSLKEKTAVRGLNVAIIGAGGAARAIGYGITAEGGRITIINRTIKRGERLAEDLGADFQPLAKINSLDCRILINATSAGMFPRVDTVPIKKELLKKGMLVMDIIYNPLKTLFLQAAQNRGCRVIDGVSMFVYQGADQFELWTGKKAPVNAMRKTVLAALAKAEIKMKSNSH